MAWVVSFPHFVAFTCTVNIIQMALPKNCMCFLAQIEGKEPVLMSALMHNCSILAVSCLEICLRLQLGQFHRTCVYMTFKCIWKALNPYCERSSGSLWGAKVTVRNPCWWWICLWEVSAVCLVLSAVCSDGAVLAAVSLSPVPGDHGEAAWQWVSFKPNWPKQREHRCSGDQQGACMLNISAA